MQFQSDNFKWQLMARTLSGEASLEENILLEKYLTEDETLKQQYNALLHFWNAGKAADVAEENESKEHIETIFRKANSTGYKNIFEYKKTRLKRRRIFAGITAGLLIALSLAVFFNLNKTNNKIVETAAPVINNYQLVAQNGSRSRTVLPDGSVVWLNAGSVLNYSGLTATQRQVYLKGEAFFDVVKDAKHPFIVHANGVDIKVLGTAFNVKSYTEDNKVEATLIRGIIQVIRQDNKNAKPVFLHPNEKLIINLKKETPQGNSEATAGATAPDFKLYHLDSIAKTENLIETSWLYNRLEFRGDNFEELAKKLERWFNIKIFFKDEEVKKLSFTGSFENETAAQAFEALKTAEIFSYTIKENEVFITSVK